MARPDNLKYTKTHEWIRMDGDVAEIGITDHAVEQLGDLTFVELPPVGTSVARDDRFGEIESTKTVSDLYAPAAGEVVAINDGLESDVSPVAESPFESGWLVRIRVSDPSELDGLLSAAGYQALIDAEEH